VVKCNLGYGGHEGPLPDPTQLRDHPERTAVVQHLFEAFVRASYQAGDSPERGRWPADKAERWLVFLEHTIHGTNLVWWEVQAAGMTVGLTTGLGTGLETVPPDFTTPASPHGTLRRDLRAALIVTLAVGITVGLGADFG
jgi:hypothetical protein